MRKRSECGQNQMVRKERSKMYRERERENRIEEYLTLYLSNNIKV